MRFAAGSPGFRFEVGALLGGGGRSAAAESGESLESGAAVGPLHDGGEICVVRVGDLGDVGVTVSDAALGLGFLAEKA